MESTECTSSGVAAFYHFLQAKVCDFQWSLKEEFSFCSGTYLGLFGAEAASEVYVVFITLTCFLCDGSDLGWGWKKKGYICCPGLSIYEESDGISFSCTWKDHQSQDFSAWSWKWGKKRMTDMKIETNSLLSQIIIRSSQRNKCGESWNNGTAGCVGWIWLKSGTVFLNNESLWLLRTRSMKR